MRKKLKLGRILNYMVYNMYFEMLFLYLLLFFSIVMPILALIISIGGGLIQSVISVDFIDALANTVRRLLYSAQVNFLLIIITLIAIILIIISFNRVKKGTFLDSFLMAKILKNYNSDFKIFLGIFIPIFLMALYFALFMSEGYFNYYSFLRMLIVSIVGLTLLNYAEQINIIMKNIEDIGRINRRVKRDNLISSFTEKSLDMLDNIDDNIKESIENQLKSERLKTELITNISHDLKTPLTSIINYTDLLKKYELENEDIKAYIDVLDRNSQRLKVLITDLVEASKTETGNINLQLQKLELNELIYQVYGEFDNVFKEKEISFIFNPKEEYFVYADGSHLGRVIENIIGNASKYSQEKTRVFAMITDEDGYISLVIKNVSRDELNISPDELMERFVRGERSRHTEGSGLGLYIAKNLMELMNGKLSITIDGDLFGINLLLPKAK